MKQASRPLAWILALAALWPMVAVAQSASVCPGEVVEHVFRGRQTRFQIDKRSCRTQVDCPGDTSCDVLRTPIPGTGGFREWCGCPGSEEPKECHAAVVHQPPPPGTLPGFRGELDCFFDCPNEGEVCCPVLVRSEIERRGRLQRFVNRYACACLGEGTLRDGQCPVLPQPGRR